MRADTRMAQFFGHNGEQIEQVIEKAVRLEMNSFGTLGYYQICNKIGILNECFECYT